MIDRSPEEVTWFAEPPVGAGIVYLLELKKGPVTWFWRPLVWPFWNHVIQGPVRFWSVAGPDEQVLDALERRGLADLRRLVATARGGAGAAGGWSSRLPWPTSAG